METYTWHLYAVTSSDPRAQFVLSFVRSPRHHFVLLACRLCACLFLRCSCKAIVTSNCLLLTDRSGADSTCLPRALQLLDALLGAAHTQTLLGLLGGRPPPLKIQYLAPPSGLHALRCSPRDFQHWPRKSDGRGFCFPRTQGGTFHFHPKSELAVWLFGVKPPPVVGSGSSMMSLESSRTFPVSINTKLWSFFVGLLIGWDTLNYFKC